MLSITTMTTNVMSLTRGKLKKFTEKPTLERAKVVPFMLTSKLIQKLSLNEHAIVMLKNIKLLKITSLSETSPINAFTCALSAEDLNLLHEPASVILHKLELTLLTIVEQAK